jgi:hypothetical protein
MTPNAAQQQTPRRIALSERIGLCLAGAAAITVVAVGIVIAIGGRNPPATPMTPITAYATPEKVQAAVAAQYSCTPSLSYIEFAVSDHTGTGYWAGCGRWLYWAFINPQGQIKVSRHFEWNGH